MCAHRDRQRGFSLVEILVGVVIAMLTTLVIHRVVVVSEKLRRDLQAAGDAQQTGLFVMSRLALEIANAGAGFAASANALGTCPAAADVAATLRPIVALITDGGDDETSDSVVVRQGVAPASAAAVSLAAAAPAGSPFQVAAVDGFTQGDRIVAISRRGDCAATEVTGVRSVAPGILELAHESVAIDLPDSALLVNLGASGRATTLRFDVASAVLRTTDIGNGDAPNPLASNVALLKFQYGIDVDGDGTLDTWVRARDAGAYGTWTSAAVLAAPFDTLRRVKAIRVGAIVRGDFQDRARREGFPWVLFDCAAADKSTCPGRLTGTFAPGSAGGWRYRVYEGVVPLRNPPGGAS